MMACGLRMSIGKISKRLDDGSNHSLFWWRYRMPYAAYDWRSKKSCICLRSYVASIVLDVLCRVTIIPLDVHLRRDDVTNSEYTRQVLVILLRFLLCQCFHRKWNFSIVLVHGTWRIYRWWYLFAVHTMHLGNNIVSCSYVVIGQYVPSYRPFFELPGEPKSASCHLCQYHRHCTIQAKIISFLRPIGRYLSGIFWFGAHENKPFIVQWGIAASCSR